MGQQVVLQEASFLSNDIRPKSCSKLKYDTNRTQTRLGLLRAENGAITPWPELGLQLEPIFPTSARGSLLDRRTIVDAHAIVARPSTKNKAQDQKMHQTENINQ